MTHDKTFDAIDSVADRKAQLERDIRNAVSDMTAEFRRDTGLSASSISIYMAETTKLGDQFRTHVVASVSAGLEVWR